MKKYPDTHAGSYPLEIEITATKVFVAENIREEQIEFEDGEITTDYVFDYYEYDKDEYILNMQEQLTDTQLALCELYEELV